MRAVENSEFKIAYFPVPKVASTSMKRAFYQLEHGHPYQPPGRGAGVHGVYPSADSFYSIRPGRYRDYARIAVIRDPARRIISAYHHRVVQLGELAENRIDMGLARALGVVPNPSRHEFLCNLEKYRVLSKAIRHHTEPFTRFLGHDMSYFTDVVKIGNLPELAAQIEALTGREFALGHYQKSSQQSVSLHMKPQAREALLSYCAGDYALLRGYFAIPEALR